MRGYRLCNCNSYVVLRITVVTLPLTRIPVEEEVKEENEEAVKMG